MPRHKRPFKTWQKIRGTCAWVGSDYVMRFWHPIKDVPREIRVSALNRHGYNIPIVNDAVEATSVKCDVWFNVPRNKSTIDLLTGDDLKIARGEMKDE